MTIQDEIARRIDALIVETMTGGRSPEPEGWLQVMKDGSFHHCNKYCPCRQPRRYGWAGVINTDFIT